MLAGVCFCYNQDKSDSYIPYEKIREKKRKEFNQVTKLFNNENSESKVNELGSDRLWIH